MIDLAPFENALEHRSYCSLAGLPYEEGTIGFKFFDDSRKIGLCQFKLVGSVAYVLGVKSIEDNFSLKILANLFACVVEFFGKLDASSVVYPIQEESDVMIAESIGFDRVSETLYVFDFAEESSREECHDENCSCHHHDHSSSCDHDHR